MKEEDLEVLREKAAGRCGGLAREGGRRQRMVENGRLAGGRAEEVVDWVGRGWNQSSTISACRP